MDTNSAAHLKAKARAAKIIFALSFYPLAFLYFLFACPILGNFAYAGLDILIGSRCPFLGNATYAPCFYNGVDIGKLEVSYGLGMLVLGIANPILAISVIKALIPLWLLAAWLATIVVSYVFSRVYKSRLAKVHV